MTLKHTGRLFGSEKDPLRTAGSYRRAMKETDEEHNTVICMYENIIRISIMLYANLKM